MGSLTDLLKSTRKNIGRNLSICGLAAAASLAPMTATAGNKYVPEPIMRESFEEPASLVENGGIIYGDGEIVENGLEGQGIRFGPKSSVGFPVDLTPEGTIIYWFKPGYDLKNVPEGLDIELFETDNFPGANSLANWVHGSKWGLHGVLEAKNIYGDYNQAWSDKPFKDNGWHQMAIQWRLSGKNDDFVLASIYVDNKVGDSIRGLDYYLDFANINEIFFGDTSYHEYGGGKAIFDEIEVYDSVNKKIIKNNWKRFKGLRNTDLKNSK